MSARVMPQGRDWVYGPLHPLKQALARAVFRAAGIRQIHIVGCSRSGTTVAHAAMAAFARTRLSPYETPPLQPFLGRRLLIAREFARDGAGPKTYVTKRNFAWWREVNLAKLADRVRRERVGLVEVVRDPRDTMLSRHVNHAGGAESYVTVEHWRRSVEAAAALRTMIGPDAAVFTLRYEDLVLEPARTAAALGAAFGLVLRPGATLDDIGGSLRAAGADLAERSQRSLGGVRRLDASSVGRWRGHADNPEPAILADAEAAPLYHAFLSTHGYDPATRAADR